MDSNKIKTISITKSELKIITEAIRYQRILNKYEGNKVYQNLDKKLGELSPYFEYSIRPIMYDEF